MQNSERSLSQGEVKVLLKNFRENDTLNTAGKRIISNLFVPILNSAFIFSEAMSIPIPIAGKGIYKLKQSIRARGWGPRDVGSHYDSLQGVVTAGGVLTQNIPVSREIETTYRFNILDLADTELGALEITNAFIGQIMPELGIYIEKNALAFFEDIIENGFDLQTDDIITPQAPVFPEILPVTYLDVSGNIDEAATKQTIDDLLFKLIEIQKIESPIGYKKKIDNWKVWMTRELEMAIQKIDGFLVFGADGQFQRGILGNVPTRRLLQSVEVIISEFVPKHLGYIAIPNDIFMTKKPDTILSNMGFVPILTASEKFVHFEIANFDYSLNYWKTRYHKFIVGNVQNGVARAQAFFSDLDVALGNANAKYFIENRYDGAVAANYVVKIFDKLGFEVSSQPPVLIDGTVETIAIVDADPDNYTIEIFFDGGTGAEQITVSNSFQIKNQTKPSYVDNTGVITNMKFSAPFSKGGKPVFKENANKAKVMEREDYKKLHLQEIVKRKELFNKKLKARQTKLLIDRKGISGGFDFEGADKISETLKQTNLLSNSFEQLKAKIDKQEAEIKTLKTEKDKILKTSK